jgi:DNA invertase Pin-like site-specific DNA recombinase
MTTYGYPRVSMDGQTLDAQITQYAALNGYAHNIGGWEDG